MRVNQQMYKKLYNLYTTQEEAPKSWFEVARQAMILKGNTRLTQGEKQAVTNVFNEFNTD